MDPMLSRLRTPHKADALIEEMGLPQAAAQCRVAGLIFTYRCTIRCRHCLFGCAGDRPEVAMSPEQCAQGLALLHETGRVVHVAGGEPMLYWESLADGIRLAHAAGNPPHFVETNCSFAADDEVVRRRFGFLADHGVRGVYASADPFHQEFVPAAYFLRVRRWAREIFGERHFFGSGAAEVQIEELEAIGGDEAARQEYVRRHPPLAVGRAHRELARYLPQRAPGDPELPQRGWQGDRPGVGCLAEFRADTMWELHLDPYGNLQTNCGMVLGQVGEVRPAQLLQRGPEHANRFVEAVGAHGAMGLAELAQRECGFVLPEAVSQSCELCYLARCCLRRRYPEVFGPAEVYA